MYASAIIAFADPYLSFSPSIAQGRTHKLVDSCYSFWVGAIFPLVEQVLRGDTATANAPEMALFDTSALQVGADFEELGFPFGDFK